MTYANVLGETETFVPPKHSEEGTQGGPSLRLLGPKQGFYGVRDPLGPARPIVVVSIYSEWSGTWSAPRAWTSPVKSIIDVRPALDVVSILEARHRLQALRARAQAKGLLQVVPWPEESEEDVAERRETSEAMMGLQAESLYERD